VWSASGEAHKEPTKPYVVAELPEATAEEARIREHGFTLKFGFASLNDYSAFDQDADSLAQVGEQEDQWEPRLERLMLRGSLGKQCVSALVVKTWRSQSGRPDRSLLSSPTARATASRQATWTRSVAAPGS
jgi:hypothetical protein